MLGRYDDTNGQVIAVMIKKFGSLLAILLAVVGGYYWGQRDDKTTDTPTSTAEVAPMPSPPQDEPILEHSLDRAQALDRALELPRPSGRSADFLVTHRLEDGSVNYSLEYDSERYHARWVAFTFDEANSVKKTKRSDAWAWDPQLPSRLNTERLFKGSGYSRGHLVASEDRSASYEANAQTFYYSNMSPQLQEHNSGIWARLENKVQTWGRSARLRRVLYVAKGGTISDDLILSERVKGKIVVPRYYWMALLAEKDGEYHSIAFLTEHRAYERGESDLKRLALSVDSLERFTGLDFFYNLPDSIEAAVEQELPDSPIARRTWWR